MEFLLLWTNLMFLLWLALVLILDTSPQVREGRSFPSAKSHTSSNDSPREG